MLELLEGRYVSRIWFVDSPGFDWLATLWRDAEGPWKVTMRFRYDAHNEEPEKRNGYDVILTDVTEAAAVAGFGPYARKLHTKLSGAELHSIVVGSDSLERVVVLLLAQPFADQLTEEDYRRG